MDFVRNGCDQTEQKLSGDGRWSLLVQFDVGELRCSVDGDEHMELALLGADFGNVDVEVAERIGFELLADGFVAFDIDKLGNAMALQTTMQ